MKKRSRLPLRIPVTLSRLPIVEVRASPPPPGPLLPLTLLVCGIPPEFCEYGGSWGKCRVWIEEHLPELYARLSLGDQTAERTAKEEKEGKREKEKEKEREKARAEAAITIELVERTKRKRVTFVIGLEAAGVKLADAAKACRKKLATGCNASKEKGGCLVMQGDHGQDVAALLKQTWPQQLGKITFKFIQGAKMSKDDGKDEDEEDDDDDEDDDD